MALTITESSATVGTAELSIISGTTSLPTETTDRIEQAIIFWHNLAIGDVYKIRVYETANAAKRQVAQWFVANVQASPGAAIPAILLGNGYDITVTKVAGTDRVIFWTLNRVT